MGKQVLRVASVLLLSILTGCSKHIAVTVLDGETGRPLDAGRVCAPNSRISPIDPLWFASPGRSCDRISGGRATVSWNPRRSPVVEVTAPGYLPGWAEFFGRDQQTGRVQVKLYRQPPPVVTLVVPRGYRGLLKVGFRLASEHEACPAGTRQFTFETLPDKINVFAWSPVLKYISAWNYGGVYDDGTPIPDGRHAALEQVALRYVNGVTPKGSSSVYLFCVGTAAEAKQWSDEVNRQTSWYGSAVGMAWVEQLGRQEPAFSSEGFSSTKSTDKKR